MARHFIGTTTDYLQLNSAFDPAFMPISIAAWVNPTSSGVNNIIISSTINSGLALFINVNNKKLNFAKTGVADVGISTGTVANGVWTHVGVTSDGTTWRFYIGGVFDSSGAVGSNAPLAVRGPYLLGRDPVDNLNLTGSLADVAVFNSILSPVEFAALAKGVRRPHQLRRVSFLFCPLDGYDNPVLDYSIRNFNPNTVVGTGTSLIPGPPLIGPLKIVLPQSVKTTAAVATTVFRRSLSPIGTRVGSRQAIQ